MIDRTGTILRLLALTAFLLTVTTNLPAQHAIDTGSGFAMAPPHYYEHGFDEPFHHLGLQLQGGLTRLGDYEYSVGPAYATVVEDHLVPLSLTATVTWHADPFDLPIGIGLGYQRTSLRTVVDYAGVPVRRPDDDTVMMDAEFEARNVAESIVLDLTIDLATIDLGPGEIFLRTGLRNRASLSQERSESIMLRNGSGYIVLGDTVPLTHNGIGAILVSHQVNDFGFDLALNVGLGWRMGFPGSTKIDTDSTEFDEFDFGHAETYGPILINPTIDFYFPILGSRPIEQASWEVQMGVGFVVPL